ncbi:E3 ubiquitin/ISG15 ligase TRIM25-like isoform X2 [Stegastes partitus]|uniref:E3 ubiquitin/ISG15 ligase TRIM25-like isoform X2 n=1 Tax=Stegastes partitus TaxID=144197 RepID=A0A9Y4JKV1_9TELE|nr:PREDICTED: E3 ubiquitin/ISG15 ligase TRIM25-like isoform X2 [Stegastes partitus]
MAAMEEAPFSLLSLEEELTCSICLSPFYTPVTIPCGHNFCQDCLLATWKDSYSCPQCRTVFATKPELKKNTVLSSVVETFRSRTGDPTKEPSVAEPKEPKIRCDTCMEAEAAQTCLTCMASFCEEHLRPHRENPTFRVHQLSEPVGDLSERICPDHHKLMELFCSQHGRPICSLCLQQAHRGCSFSSPEEQRSLLESDLRSKLTLLDGKITANQTVISQMTDMQNKLKDSASKRKQTLAAEYQQIRTMLAREEQDALNAVDQEVESGHTKVRVLVKKFTDNIDNMNKAKNDIHDLLGQSRSLAFLQASFNLPDAVKFEPYSPRLSLDSKKVLAAQAFSAALKDHLTEMLKPPVESRLPLVKAAERPTFPSGFTPVNFGMYPTMEPQWFPGPNRMPPPVQNPGPQPKPGQKKKPAKNKKDSQSTSDKTGNKNFARSMENLLDVGKDKSRGRNPAPEPKPETVDVPLNISSAEKRNELLKYGTVLTLDPRTAHKRITLSDGFTKASVSDEHNNYPDCPSRFAVCSQVLASKGFSCGRHYWEVRLSSNNFIGIGLAYGTIDRKGPTSRLGRNNQSWCVEWFNVKLSAWHNSSETVLANPNPKRVGILLDCEQGAATFYNVADRAYPFHTFVFPFAEAVYPAFWIFSSGSSITLCKLQA